MTRSRDLFGRAKRVLPGGVNSPVRAFRAVGGTPFFVAAAHGSSIRDVDGRKYIDYVCSWGPLILGHAHPAVLEAVCQAAQRGWTYGAPCEAEVELAEEVRRRMPGLEMMRFVNSGTEATMAAVRLARAATGRDLIVKFEGCYHGHADGFLVKAGSGVATLGLPDSPGVPAALASLTLTAPFNDARAVADLFREHAHHIAAVIVEPYVGNVGFISPEPDFHSSLRHVCDQYGALLIFDEVMTGFRVSAGGAQERLGVQPDLTTLGKIVGGGFPVGVYGGRVDLMKRVAPEGPVYQAGTLSGNPVAMAAGLATLRETNRPDFYDQLEQKTKRLMTGLERAAQRHGVAVTLGHAGSMWGIYFTEGRSGTTLTRSAPTPRSSRAGTRRRSRAACSSRRPPSRRASCRRRIRRPISILRSHSSMQRWPTRALASVALLATLACPRPARVPQPAAAGEPELRIGLAVGLPNASVGGPEGGELFVSEAASGTAVGSIPAGVRWVVLPDSADPSRLRLVKPDSTRTEALRGIAVVNVTERRFVVANGRRYRGRIDITSSRGGLTVVNRVTVESYIAGVVPPEIGARRPDERAAVLAQAVVSRSFAIKNRGRWDAFGFDAYADTRDQVYLGVAVETVQAWDAVRTTAGQVLTYDGDVIDAFFHSACGSTTAGVEEAFATARTRPYLRPVSDDRGGGHSYCDISPRFRWREQWDGPKLRAILSRTLPAVTPLSGDGLQKITDVTVSRTTRSGRVGELRIVFERGDIRIPGPDVRAVLRPEADRLLSSTAFQLTVTKDNGEVTRVVAVGGGSGHAVGMCQWGAIGRARAGQDYRAILTTYFPGTKIEKLY